MIVDITGTVLLPGNLGKDCLGNGEHKDKYGKPIELCCDECDYMLCCIETHSDEACKSCEDKYCPRSPNLKLP